MHSSRRHRTLLKRLNGESPAELKFPVLGYVPKMTEGRGFNGHLHTHVRSGSIHRSEFPSTGDGYETRGLHTQRDAARPRKERGSDTCSGATNPEDMILGDRKDKLGVVVVSLTRRAQSSRITKTERRAETAGVGAGKGCGQRV